MTERSLLVAGSFDGRLRLGEQTLEAGSSNSSFLARTSVDGQLAWSRTLQAGEPVPITAVALGADERAFIALSATGRFQLAGHDSSTTGNPGSVIAALDGDGRVTWSVPMHSSQYARVTALAANDDLVIAVGVFAGTVRIGRRVLSSAGVGDVLVACLSARDGGLRWAIRAGGQGPDAAMAVALRGDRIAVAGQFSNRARMGAVRLHAREPEQKKKKRRSRRTRQDAFAASLLLSGEIAWVAPMGGVRTDAAYGIALDSERTYVVGAFTDRIGRYEYEVESAGDDDGFVAALGGDGRTQWLVRMGGPGRDHALVVASLDDGVALAGTFENRMDVGPHALESRGAHDVFTAWVTAAGRVTWAERLGGTGHDTVAGIASDERGAVTLVGSFSGEAWLGGDEPVTTTGARSGFVARFH